MDLNFIIPFVIYIVIGMLMAIIASFSDYLVGDYYALITFLYPIVIPILMYFELKRFIKEFKK